MVEFAIILPLLIMLLFGITELGRALFQQNSLYKAVESGARYLSRSSATLGEAAVCPSTEADANWATRVTEATNLIVYGTATVSGSPIPLLPHLNDSNVISIDTVTRTLTKSDDETVPVCVIAVTATVPFVGLFGEIAIPFTTIEAFSLRAETEERYIGL